MSDVVQEPKALVRLSGKKRELAAIAKEAGVSAVDFQKLRQSVLVGSLIEELGALDVGMGMYIFGKNKLEESIEKINEQIAQSDNDEMVAALGEVQRKLILAYREYATGIIEAHNSKSSPSGMNPPRSFPPQAFVQAVVINPTAPSNEPKPAKVTP